MTTISDDSKDIDYKKMYEAVVIENEELKKRLKNYTSPARKKKYYDTHKEELNKKSKEYREKTGYTKKPSPEKAKEYARRAYLKKKQKKMEAINNNL